MKRKASSYDDYLKVGELLKLQQRLSDPPHHDELLFIIIHQVYELWFRQMIHEIEAILSALSAGRVRQATRLYRRLIEIQRVILQQISVLETMTPIDFNEFRDLLNPASGFQSRQFRELEFLSGMKDPVYLKLAGSDAPARETLERRLAGPTLGEGFDDLLRSRGFPVAPAGGEGIAASRIAALKTIYERHDDHDDLYQLCEAMIEYDENFQLWRYHHIRMVERMIGRKPGTGGSEGVGYLARTLDKRCFPELWEVRTHLSSGGAYGG
ncbi:MAG TPA: tryptophan 2,3-dioxygenase family protein [Candidatus Polarisedimenticolia bacterium]|jgi:tryptophan 2,3-dioxygenase